MKKKKNKASTSNKENVPSASSEVAKRKLFRAYNEEMEDKTNSFKMKNTSLDTKFYLFQTLSNKEKVRDMIFNLVYFYDINFTGNKDFMHIPNINNVLNNVTKYPILLATTKDDKGIEDILGTATVKYEYNTSIDQNPYFPTMGEDVVSITGILTKYEQDEKRKVRGIGKELYKSAIKAAYQVNKDNPLRLIVELDCRNVPSFKAVTKACEELKEEGINLNVAISGYYEIKNRLGFVEAPTFVVEIDFNNKLEVSEKETTFNYSNLNIDNINRDLSQYLRHNTEEEKKYINVLSNGNNVIFHKIEPINNFKFEMEVGNTADGNQRTPSLNLQLVVND